MARRRTRYKVRRRHRSIMSTNAGPILMLSATIIGILGAIALILFVLLPWLLPFIGVDYTPPFMPAPTPAPTAIPTPTPHPITQYDFVDLEREIVLPRENQEMRQYTWFGDPFAYDGKIIFTVGKLEDGKALMQGLCQYTIAESHYELLDYQLSNDSYYYPRMNADWFVYVDAKADGGGYIRALNLATNENTIVKQVYVGTPVLNLMDNMLIWTERTGTRMDKLFVCDLTSMESVTLEMFENSEYGLSAPSAAGGQIIWAGEDIALSEEGSFYSAIYSISSGQSSPSTYSPGTYVHDPMTNGKQWTWIDSNHGDNAKLYYYDSANPSQKAAVIAENVTNYAIGDTFIAYTKDSQIWLYLFGETEQYCLTQQSDQLGQLLGISNGIVFWMDVSSRDKDILKYAEIPH